MAGKRHQGQQLFAPGSRPGNSGGASSLWNFLDPPPIQEHVTWEWNIPANTVVYSKEWRHILLDTDDASLGPGTDAWWPRMHEEDVEPFLRAARDIVEGRTDNYRSLCRVQRTDGSWAWLLSRGSVMEKSGGKAVLVLGALMDVSELRGDTKFLHGTIGPVTFRTEAETEPGPDFTVRTNRSLSSLTGNPLVCSLLAGNRPGDSLSEWGVAPRLSPEQLAYIREKVANVLSTGTPERETVSFPTLYGHDVVGEYAFCPEFDQSGRVTAVTTRFRDTTEQLLAERRARHNELRLDALYRLTQMHNADEQSVMHFVMDRLIELTGSEHGFLFFPKRSSEGGHTLFWSESHQEILQQADLTEEALFAGFERQFGLEYGFHVDRIIENGNSLHPLYNTLNGHLPIMRYILAPAVESGDTVCIAGVCNKTTDYTQADLQQTEAFIHGAWLILRRQEFVRELQRTKEVAEQANRVKDVFLANISHELRTPLNGMLGMLQLIDLSSLAEEQQKYVRAANFSGQALLRIISDILDFSHMASGKMILKYEPFDFRLSLESCLSFFRREAGKKGLDFTVSVDEAVPPVLVGDDARVMQVVFNIVGNALKFTERGSIQVDCSLVSRNREGQAFVYVGVKDTGIGISPDKLDAVFEAFTQIDSSSTRRYPGTGLGLGIAQNLVELMGGSIAIESEVGKGTTIHCVFCFTEPEADEKPGTATPGKRHFLPVRRLDILVAEDDPVGSFALRRYLEKMGHRPVCVTNGRQALEALRLYPFHCLFTDIQMPVMDGMELIRRIRENRIWDAAPSPETRELLSRVMPGAYAETIAVPRNLPVTTISAHTMTGDKERFLEAGMDFYLSKPLATEELADVLHRIIVHLVMQEKLLTDTYVIAKQEPGPDVL